MRSVPWSTAYGEFDLAHGADEQTDNLGGQTRYVGGAAYETLTDDFRADLSLEGTPASAWASWYELPNTPQPPGVGMKPAERQRGAARGGVRAVAAGAFG